MKRERGRLLLIVLGALTVPVLSAGVAAPAPDAEALAQLDLRDQFGQVDSLARLRGAPAVVVVVNVRRLSMIERWERDLSARVPGLRFLNVADLPADAPVDLARTAAMLRKRVPAGVSVLMDAERRWATGYALDTAVPNLLVFDADGRFTGRFRGRWTETLALEVVKAIPAPAPNGELSR